MYLKTRVVRWSSFWFTSSNFDDCLKKHREVGRLGSNLNSNKIVSNSREVGRFVRFVSFISSNFDECVNKQREVGRLGSNQNSNDVVSKSREVGRFARFVSFGSHLQILMSV